MTVPFPAPLPAHLGGLHPFEQLAVMVLAFGPFVVLGVVVAVQRRRALAEEQAGEQAGEQAADQAGEAGDPAERPGESA